MDDKAQKKLNRFHRLLEEAYVDGHGRYYEIWIDDQPVVRRTQDPDQFWNFMDYLDDDCEEIRIKSFHGESNNNQELLVPLRAPRQAGHTSNEAYHALELDYQRLEVNYEHLKAKYEEALESLEIAESRLEEQESKGLKALNGLDKEDLLGVFGSLGEVIRAVREQPGMGGGLAGTDGLSMPPHAVDAYYALPPVSRPMAESLLVQVGLAPHLLPHLLTAAQRWAKQETAPSAPQVRRKVAPMVEPQNEANDDPKDPDLHELCV